MLNQDESLAFWEHDNGNQTISFLSGNTRVCVFFEVVIFECESVFSSSYMQQYQVICTEDVG